MSFVDNSRVKMDTYVPKVAGNWEKLPNLPDEEGYAGMYAGVAVDAHTGAAALLAAGGANFPEKPLWEGGPKRWTDRVFLLTPDARDWSEPVKLPKPMGYGATVSLPKGVMLIGGCNADGVFRDCLLISLNSGTLQIAPLAPLPVGLTGHAAVLLDGKVYVLGGSLSPGEQDAQSSLFIYDPAADAWSEGKSLPARGRFLHQMAVVSGALYVLGGIGIKPGENGRMVRDMLTEAWLYTPQGGWDRVADLPRFCAAAPTPAPVSPAGKIYLLGGDDASVKGVNSPQCHPGFHSVSLSYCPACNTWKEEGPIPAPRAVLPCAVWNGRAVIFNGEQRPGKRSNEVWAASLS